MNKFPKADTFQMIPIKPLKCKAAKGVVYVGEMNLDQIAIVGPDADTAYRAAVNHFGPHFKQEGARNVVMLREDHFQQLMKLAGIDMPEVA